MKKPGSSIEKSPTFCVYPFSVLFLSQKGRSYPCCFSDSASDALSEPEFSKVKVKTKEDIQQAWNAPLLRTVRRQMLRGVRPEPCTLCFQMEDGGARSPRNLYESQLFDHAAVAAESMDSEGRIDSIPKVFDLQMGNRCNLKCRMCSPGYSVNLIEEQTEIFEFDFSEERANYWLGNQALIDAIAASASECVELRVIGGEPFVTKEFFQLLRMLVEKDFAARIHLRFNTNLTIFPDEAFALFRRFKGVSLMVSLDGFKAVNDYIRYPSRFAVIDKNLHFLHDNMDALGISEVRFNTTVQIYNIFGLVDLFRYLREPFPKFHWFPVLSILSKPEPLSVLVLPLAARREAKSALDSYLDEERERWARSEEPKFEFAWLEQELRSVIRYLDGEGKSDLIPQFLRMNEIYDRHRGQNIGFPIPGILLDL